MMAQKQPLRITDRRRQSQVPPKVRDWYRPGTFQSYLSGITPVDPRSGMGNFNDRRTS